MYRMADCFLSFHFLPPLSPHKMGNLITLQSVITVTSGDGGGGHYGGQYGGKNGRRNCSLI